MIEANWVAFVIVLLLGMLVAWWLLRHGATVQRPRERKPDVLDEGAAPAARNQALIDAPPAADLAPLPASATMAGLGEIIAVAAEDEVEQQPLSYATEAGEGDDLRKIKGIGPKLAVLLNSLGVTRFEQIAAWSEEDIDRIDARLGAFAGRPRRDNWVEQARLLASGDTAAYEARFGKL